MLSGKTAQVVRGEGMLHSHKVQYSKETHQLLKVLLEESKLSILQRQQIQKSLRTGEPLPPLSSEENVKSGIHSAHNTPVKKVFHKRRTLEDIIESGAYERERFISNNPRVDKEKEKQKFQSLMAHGKIIPPTPVHKIRAPPKEPLQTPKPSERFSELMGEILERLQFLAEMREMGCDKNYNTVIQQQIHAKLREMKRIDPQQCQAFQRSNNLYS
ncbi:UPF0193 protein EVG1 [Blattella germanica]|nr:UPF0193 protein EVG1 [Blattella germanica]